MAIVNHERVKVEVERPWGKVTEPAKIVKCDSCGSVAKKPGSDFGEAALKAKKEGFKTVHKGLGEPMGWWCGKCSK
jgi:hypothetical protein